MRNITRQTCGTVLVAALLTVAVTAYADVPRIISYQGRLLGQGNDLVELEVTFYDSAAGSTVLFSETHTGVPLHNGIFSIGIGSQTTDGIPDSALDAPAVWLGLRVGAGQELSPRTRIGMVPFAGKAASAEQLVRPGTMDPAVSVSDTGNVGIGTDTPLPGSTLHVVHPNSIAVLGECSGEGTRGYLGHEWAGVVGQADQANGFGGYFYGRGYFSGDVGLGADNPQAKLHIVGPDDAQDGPLIMLEADTADSVESGRIRFGESTGDLRGAFIHYDGLSGKLHLGTHISPDSIPANDINAITIDQYNGNVGINREWAAWPLHVGGDAYFEERVGIGASGTGAQLHVGGETRLDGHVEIGNASYSGKLEVATDSDNRAISTMNTKAGGTGLYGRADGNSGETRGVEGFANNSPDSIGVKGTGHAIGVRGQAMGALGFGGYFDGRGYFSGDVGIGTTEPTARLHITGDPGNDGIRFPDDTLLTTAHPTWHRVNDDACYMDGRVGIGTTAPLSRLAVIGPTSAYEAIYAEIETSAHYVAAVHGVAATQVEDAYAIGLHGEGNGSDGIGVLAEGDLYGLKAECTDGSNAIYAFSSGTTYSTLSAIAVDGYAGRFYGDVHVSGTLTKSGGDFKIDHPLDPENKYLHHSFVESPDMMNIYNGNVVTDAHGYATIEMPEWFEPLNRGFRYQLTVVDEGDSDTFVLAKVVRKIAGNSFTIRSSVPKVEVSWQLTGIRQDAWANAHRIPVESDKPDDERGYYIHPEVHSRTIEESITWQKLPPSEREEILEKLRLSRAEGAQEAEGGTQ